MKTICFYFQVHQPFRLRHYKVQDIGEHNNYFDDEKNKEVFRKVAEKSYLPTNKLMLKLCQKHPEFRFSFSVSGILLDQCELWGQDVLDSFKKLIKTGQVEILAETACHSLAAIYSKKEFAEQILKHRKMIETHFGVSPTVFRNTELIYSNEIAEFIRLMGFNGIIAEGADHILDWRSPNHLYQALNCKLPREIEGLARKNNINIQKKSPKSRKRSHCPPACLPGPKRNRRLIKRKLPLLLKNYKLSDDIAFRFSNKGWPEHPLSAEKFAAWVDAAEGETVNLFMDYETFGEHQWEDTGIFQFLEYLPEKLKERGIGFRTPSETIEDLKPIAEIDMHSPVSWADLERDLSAWLGNDIQAAALETIYSLEDQITNLKNIYRNIDPKDLKEPKDLVETWQRLQTSDLFYYMCTKYWSDGDVHKYFSPYDSPYDAYIYYMNVLSDFERRLNQHLKLPPEF